MSSDSKVPSSDAEEPISRNEDKSNGDAAADEILNGLLTHGRKTCSVQAAGDRLASGNGKQKNGYSKRASGPLLSGVCYCFSSCSMILLNKVVLSTYNFDAGVSLMLYQNLISVIIVVALGLLGVVSTEKLTWKLIRVWIPVNAIFVGMLVTGMYSLKYINVAMVTILKNLTNILTAIGEMYLFRKHQNGKVWTALFLMIISAVSGGVTDLSFDAVGYTWQIMNCILTASYSLTLRRVMDTAKQSTRSGSLNEVSMVLLNNSLSLPFGIFLILFFNEWEYVQKADKGGQSTVHECMILVNQRKTLWSLYNILSTNLDGVTTKKITVHKVNAKNTNGVLKFQLIECIIIIIIITIIIVVVFPL
ncbi:GDP-mannose transporter GONST2-like isoform X2 [Asparagus officinalis]|uniref:GDP-mannose transporter GONST2-like isoform X2 n=1 Tax=Asparagus officinalis TaxID=4686 RepID=UPI00098E6B1F|nr:GDP-mannose transporter GONST2-like isoform X2 [Asparagus officinalis]